MKHEVLVLGAGIVGTCTALHLVLRGHSVTLVDRREPGAETSYGNAGLIQREAIEPVAFPRDFPTLSRAALKRGAKISYHLDALPGTAPELARYWKNSRPTAYARIAQVHARLIAHCLSEHEALIDRAGARELVARNGFRFVYRQQATMERAIARAQRLAREGGVRHAVEDPEALAAAEPALKLRLAGAVHWLDPWSVNNPGELVKRYAALFAQLGGRFVKGDAASLRQTETGWRVRTVDGEIDGEHAVLALGPWSKEVVRAQGYRLPLFAIRGYHRHYRGGEAPRTPMLDADGGFMLSPMQQGVRITTGAEFARMNARSTPVQLGRAERLARELLDLPEAVEQDPWRGARPCSADMLPLVGPAPRHRGLWFNFGHAHQGFTLGPVSGRLLAEMIDGSEPVVDPWPYAPARFG
ncbi:NAD(P)/FAD-dependent oxidoreductase [Variovorax boronicumulans]|uniref:NAD(P)/FAD-dependent oxidoreductase n=1 Tax=Variovorax boronicumulans TaxID=436515 RepID=UPI001C573D2C